MGTFPCTLASGSSLGECARRATRLLHNQNIAQCTLFTRGHTIPEVQSQGKGWAGNCGKSGLEKLVLCLALTGPAESTPRSEFAPPDPGGRQQEGTHGKESIPLLSLAPPFMFRCTSGKHSPWLALLRPFNFLWLSMNNESKQFLFPNFIPPPSLKNLALNCQKGTFKSYKLAPLKMLKHL